MDQKLYGLIEMALSFGVALAIGFQQLWSLSRMRKRDEAEKAEKARLEQDNG